MGIPPVLSFIWYHFITVFFVWEEQPEPHFGSGLLFLERCAMIVYQKGGFSMLYLGCHLSASSGYEAMVKTAEKIDANTFAFLPAIPGDPGQSRKTPGTRPGRWSG
jgi:hypothetical protein